MILSNLLRYETSIIYYIWLRQNEINVMPSESDGKWETECINTRFLLPNLLCADAA